MITGSPFKSYTNYFENNNHILIKIPPAYTQDDDTGGIFEDGGDFEDNGDGDSDGEGEVEGDGEGDADGVENNDVGNEGINENTNESSPLSFGSLTNPIDEANSDDK